MAKSKARVKAPSSVKKGEVFEVKTLISHVMETGQRKDRKTGNKIPRMIINKFVASFNGKPAFSADWHPAISANPYMSFHMKVAESGTLEIAWTDDKGAVVKQSAKIDAT
jgi:sulfur-oxidizing protein SoxZ